jgi:FkbM family methyltransferase
MEIAAIVDKTKKEPLLNIPVYSLSEFQSMYLGGDERYDINTVEFVISAPSMKDEIKNTLLQYVSAEHIHYFEVELYECLFSNYDKYRHFLLDNVDSLYEIYEKLEDEYSKITMLQVIEGRLTGNLDTVSDIWINNQYWPDGIINFNENESLIECGSYDGGTLRTLCSKLNGSYERIYCFEPDAECKEVLLKVINEIDKEGKITFIPKGTYKESTTLHFSNEGVDTGQSKVSEFGESVIEVVAIDDVISDKITYIKMDVEGAELDTLIGAEHIITKYSPKLAICIYHNDEDILNIMKYLQGLNASYKFFMRHHNCSMTETVLYAI